MNRSLFLVLFTSCCLTIWSQEEKKRDSTLSGYKSGIYLANPTNKSVEMELDDRKAPYYRMDVKVTNPWFEWKKGVNEKTGLQISVNYSSIFMGATSKISSVNQQSTAGGVFDAIFNWNLVNRKKGKNKGSLIFWVNARHKYFGDIVPQNLNFETGSATLPMLMFNDFSVRALEFYYQQSFLNNRAAIVVGKIDMADWFTYNGMLHPLKHFSDLAFSVNPTVNWSNVGLGIIAGGWLNKKKTLGLVVGLNDVAGDNLTKDKFLDWGTYGWSNGKFLKMIELNYSPGRDQYYFQRISATYWHSDEIILSEDSWYASPSSSGFSIQGTWFIKNKYMPVVTLGMSDGDGANTLSKLNVSLMHGWNFTSHDMLGVGINYTESTISGESQFLSEVFYRYTLSKALSISPIVKAVINPALNTNKEFLGYYGVRSRISF
ncbi:MAG: hypothetical protein BM563_06165 [Bacteroidetes bacterium MedPE-SWsnd-G1]|nr:MAG: hypothetical protein BM563_06165 [Bacteroidetes bacterium MedPE-SWsnd-G1]